MNEPTAVIVLEGGLVQSVYCDQPVKAVVMDFDVEGSLDSDTVQVVLGEGTDDETSEEVFLDETECFQDVKFVNQIKGKL